MQTSNGEVPQLLLEEALASTPYLIKAALAEARDAKDGATTSDLAEIETAMTLLKVPGWVDSEGTGRPPVVRRNLLLLHSHLHRDRLKALDLTPSTREAASEVVVKCRKLLDMLFAYTMQVQWVKAVLAISSFQALLVNGLWDPAEDECRTLMRSRLAAVGLKPPKLSLRCTAADVAPGETVHVKVCVVRGHACSEAELEAYRRQLEQPAANAEGAEGLKGNDDELVRVADAQEGWWLFVESLRAAPYQGKGALLAEEVHHNILVGRQALSPSLDDPTVEAVLSFTAPSTPGEYKVLVHVRSSSMVGFDVKRKLSFTVKQGKRSQPSTSSGTSTEDAKSMEEMDASIAEMADADNTPA